MNTTSNIGLIGLAVMGENLALNMERNGFYVSVYNRPHAGGENPTERFMNDRGKGKRFQAFIDIEAFVQSLERPRKVMMMIRAGKPVDDTIAQLLPYMEPGDVIIDGGNSNYEDSERRYADLKDRGILYVGAGVSGGEEGALNGPSLMPGGHPDAWSLIQPIFEKISAKAPDGAPCCAWMGNGGAGHFVKMVHNGIEYGDMQLICEAYQLMHDWLGMDNEAMAQVFEQWNQGKLDSYLIEITGQILKHKTPHGEYLVDKILDVAGQKGTGKWSVISSMEFGSVLSLISSAVYERSLSSMKDMRCATAQAYPHQVVKAEVTPERIAHIHDSLYASKLISYTQGFRLLASASAEKGWGLDLSSIARIWRGGCIIRSVFLNRIAEAYGCNMSLEHLLLDDSFMHEIKEALPAWSGIVAQAMTLGLPLPAFSTALNYFYSLRSSRLPANLLQAQRDYFGAHTFERIDSPRGNFFHENWTGEGGETRSGTYTV